MILIMIWPSSVSCFFFSVNLSFYDSSDLYNQYQSAITPKKSIINFYSFIISDVFKFLAEDWRRNGSHSKIPLKMMHKGEAMVFNCTTNDPDADVYLRERTPGESQFRDSRTEKENRISKKDQTFVVDALQLRDRKEYECTARNASNGKISLLLGTLFVENGMWSYEIRRMYYIW